MKPVLSPTIKRRTVTASVESQLIDAGVSSLLAKIVASRPLPEHSKGSMGVVDPRLADLDAPQQMQDMDKAVARLLQALEQQEVIAIETDHDCDGQTSHAVMVTCLVQMMGHPADKVQSFIGHRMEEGYGLSEALMQRILDASPRPTLVITADNGSTDEPRIAQLAAVGVDVIVTDHHHLPEEGPPDSAIAVLNPTREDCAYPDPYIAGCMVAWLLMAATRRALIDARKLDGHAMSMAEVLDFVAVGTVADCVSLARSVNNRAVVRYGLQLIAQAKRPCWQAVMPLLKQLPIQSQDLGFVIGPLLNSDGRLSDALGSVNFLLAEDVPQATEWAQQLWQQNQARKAIQKTLTDEAMQKALQQVAAGKYSLVVAFDEGHAGVHGISASRVKDAFGRPTVLFSTKAHEPGLLSGSARSIDAVHMRDVLQVVATELPDVVVKFGGHRGAAGLTIHASGLEAFAEQFEVAVQAHLADEEVGPVVWTDGELAAHDVNLTTWQQLQTLEPYGREFDAPCFELPVQVQSIRRIGQTGTHAQLVLALENQQVCRAVWFGCCEDEQSPLPVAEGERCTAVVTLQQNVFRDQTSLQLQVVTMIAEAIPQL